MKHIFRCFFLCSIFALSTAHAMTVPQFQNKPKLVLLLVFDQFRADYLTRFSSQFLPAHSGKKVGGFQYLMQDGAYFPFARYEVLQNMTCVGHSTLLTGAYPMQSGVPLNYWFDPESKKPVYCVADKKDGTSPRSLRGTTVGDELKAASADSRVVSISLKDRAAVMMGGKNPTSALWINQKIFQWTTSSYYSTDPLSASVQKINLKLEQMKSEKLKSTTEQKQYLSGIEGMRLAEDMALTLVNDCKLGQKSATDVLAISFSNHDYSGHDFGPQSDEMKKLTIAEDRLLSEFLNSLYSKVKREEILVVMTADHGVPNDPKLNTHEKETDFRLNTKKIQADLEEHLKKGFGSAPTDSSWILAQMDLNFYLHPKATAEMRKSAKDFLKNQKGILEVVTKEEGEIGNFSKFAMKTELEHTYVAGLNGDLLAIPLPYVMTDDANFDHLSGYAYDASVPLIFLGNRITPGVYSTHALMVDLAPTLSFLLGQIAPPFSKGRVLNEMLK